MVADAKIIGSSFGVLAGALRQEQETGATDATKGLRTRHGIYSLRSKPGHYIIRIRVPAGILTEEQLETVAALTEESGWPAGAHLTTRQGIEIVGLPAADIPAALDRLAAVDLTTMRSGGPFVRGVVACAFSGVARDEIFDVTPFALAADRYFREHPEFQALPRKIKMSFEGCTHDHVRTAVSDIGVRAVRREGENGFRIVVGGGLGASPKAARVLEEFVPVEQLFPMLEAVLRVFNRHSNRQNRARGRLKWLLADWGIEKFRAEVQAELLGVGSAWTAFDRILPEIIETRPDAGSTVLPEKPAFPESDFQMWRLTNMQPQSQDGFAAVLVRCPFGDLLPTQIRLLAAVARKFAGGLRTTIDQNILLRWVPEGCLPELYQQLRSGSLAAPSAEQLPDVTRCPGASACLMAITNPRPAAEAIRRVLEPVVADDPSLCGLRIRISGCPNSCSHHHISDIGLFGVSRTFHKHPVPHYAMLLGGVSSAESFGTRLMEVPALNVAQAVRQLLGWYQAEHRPDENFGAYVGRTGLSDLKQRLEPLTRVALPAEEPAFFRDLGSDQPFAVAARGGECGV